MKRRTFLKGTAALTVLVSGGGVWRAERQGVFSPGQGSAYEPWHDWRDHDDGGPLTVVAAGILAANPHNTQPWAFRVGGSSIEVYADTARNLGAFDPFLREMYIGLGCAIENMMITAGAEGYDPVLKLVPGRLDGPPDPPVRTLVARIDLDPGAQGDGELREIIPRRHTNRGPYDPDHPIPKDVIDEIARHDDPELLVLLFSGQATQPLGELIIRATEAIIADNDMVHASERWFRHRRSDIAEFRDGPTLDAAGLSPATTAIAKLLPRPSPEENHRFWLDATRDVQVPTAPLLGLIAVRDLYDREQNLRAGRLWQRMHLRAVHRGLAMQPLNQPVEFVDRERDLGLPPRMAGSLDALTGSASWKPTFVFRAGHALRDGSPSPRRPLEAVLA